MARITVSDRHRERTPWTLDETEKLAGLFGLEVSELTVRPKGFEPLTFWLGADHTVTVLEVVGRRAYFCDGCGAAGWLADLHPAGVVHWHAINAHGGAPVVERAEVLTGRAAEVRMLLAERFSVV